jgi:hypothetical protein
MTTCTRMRTAAILSSSLLALGGLALALAELTGWAIPLAQLALWLVLGAAAALGGALLIALWPGSSARLAECRH